MKILNGSLTALVYKNLIKYACKKCDAMMFVIVKDDKCSPEAIKEFYDAIGPGYVTKIKSHKNNIDELSDIILKNKLLPAEYYTNFNFESVDEIVKVNIVKSYVKNIVNSEKFWHNIEKFKSDFDSSLIKSCHDLQWVGTKVLNADKNHIANLYDIDFYEITDSSCEKILSTGGLYDWGGYNYPEDLSFFKKGYCWLYSITHEELCEIYCEDEKEYEYLKSIGIEFVENKFIPTSKDKLYYEEY